LTALPEHHRRLRPSAPLRRSKGMVAGAEPNVPRVHPPQNLLLATCSPGSVVTSHLASPASIPEVALPNVRRWSQAVASRAGAASIALAEEEEDAPREVEALAWEAPVADKLDAGVQDDQDATSVQREDCRTSEDFAPSVSSTCRYPPEELERLLRLRRCLALCTGEVEALKELVLQDACAAGGAAAACGLPRLKEAHRCRLHGETFSIEEARRELSGGRLLEQLRRYAALVDGALSGELGERLEDADASPAPLAWTGPAEPAASAAPMTAEAAAEAAGTAEAAEAAEASSTEPPRFSKSAGCATAPPPAQAPVQLPRMAQPRGPRVMRGFRPFAD